MRPHGLERGSDAQAVQSGQMVKYYQTLAMTAGQACLLLKSSSSLSMGKLRRLGCTVHAVLVLYQVGVHRVVLGGTLA